MSHDYASARSAQDARPTVLAEPGPQALRPSGSKARRLTAPTGKQRVAPAGVLLLVLASATELWTRLEPNYDPDGWLVWGRQTIHWVLNPAGAPSWKPLTWLLATPVALTGGAAPTLWVILTCASGLVSLVLAYRLGSRLGGALGGVAAAVAVLLCRDWVLYTVTGNSEPFATALALGAVDRHLAGQRRLALGLGALVALTRPECGLILAAYIVWLWRAEPRARPLAAGVVIAGPLLWFLPPYLATGRQFGATDPVFHTGLATPGPGTVFFRSATIVTWPIALAGALGLIVAVRQGGRKRGLALALAAGALVWTAVVAVMAQADFPAIQRFMLPGGGRRQRARGRRRRLDRELGAPNLPRPSSDRHRRGAGGDDSAVRVACPLPSQGRVASNPHRTGALSGRARPFSRGRQGRRAEATPRMRLAERAARHAIHAGVGVQLGRRLGGVQIRP